jgi:hypothetical protein
LAAVTTNYQRHPKLLSPPFFGCLSPYKAEDYKVLRFFGKNPFDEKCFDGLVMLNTKWIPASFTG